MVSVFMYFHLKQNIQDVWYIWCCRPILFAKVIVVLTGRSSTFLIPDLNSILDCHAVPMVRDYPASA